MKKRWILACLVMLLACICVCAQAEMQPQAIWGGKTIQEASLVGIGIEYRTQSSDGGNVYYKLIPESSDEYYLSFLCEFFPSTGSSPWFAILDANGTVLEKKSIDLGKYDRRTETRYNYSIRTIRIILQKDMVYYIKLLTGHASSMYKMAICSGNLHPENDNMIINKQPSCTEPGQKEAACIYCGEVAERQEIPALGHKPKDWKVEKAASCKENGLKVRRCATCNAIVESEEIPALPHTLSDKKTSLAPTCVTPGERKVFCKV